MKSDQPDDSDRRLQLEDFIAELEARTTALLPRFPYHRDPVASGSLKESDAACECCGQVRGILPQGAAIIGRDPNGHWIAYEMPNGAQQVRFRASAAWLPNEPTITPNYTNITLATIHVDGRLVVLEGLHRTRAMARERVGIAPSRGGVERAPGWLDFAYDPSALRDTPSARAISEVFGSDPDAPLVPAR